MPKQGTVKLQAHLAKLGVASRRKSEAMIAEGRVVVDGETAHIGQRVTPGKEAIEVDGKSISVSDKKERVYFAINKPIGYVSSTQREEGASSVLSLLPDEITSTYRLFPVGRLDKDSRGLMIITNDGELTHTLTHPKFKHRKTYHVSTDRKLSFKALMHLRNGVKLSDGYAKPDRTDVIESDEEYYTLEMVLHEGRNRQIRRMLERVGYEVTDLQRVAIGTFHLSEIERGGWKQLTAEEVARLTELPE